MAVGAGTGRGWAVVVSYAAVAGTSQLLWLTYAPVTTAAAHHYGVSVAAIGWLANVFPLLYVVLAVPAGLALDRWPRPALAAGVVLTAFGGVVRLGGDGFGWALAGQLMVAVAQPLVLNAITGVAGVLPERSRATGIAVGSAGLFLGMVVALGAGAVVGGDHLVALATGQAVLGVLATVAFLLVQRRVPAPAIAAAAEAADLRGVWTDRILRRIAVLAFLGFGVFVALITWLQALLEPRGISESAAGAIITVAVAFGAVGSTVVSAVLAMLTALPWLLALCERRSGGSVASATALLWLAGNLGGLVVAVVVGGLVDRPTAAFLLLAAVALVGLPLVQRHRLVGDQPMAPSLELSPEQGR